MVGDNGIYLLYRNTHSPDHGHERRLVGRFALVANDIVIAEDHDGIVKRIFPPGPLDGRTLRRMEHMSDGNSPYWLLVMEQDVQQGEHPDLVEELKLGPDAWPDEEQEKPEEE